MCYFIEGKINHAYKLIQETLKLAEETGDTYIKGMAYSTYGASCYCKGLFDEAKTHLSEFTTSYEKSAPISWIVWAYASLGLLHIDLREYDDAVNCYKKIISIMEDVSFMPSIIKFFQLCLSEPRC